MQTSFVAGLPLGLALLKSLELQMGSLAGSGEMTGF